MNDGASHTKTKLNKKTPKPFSLSPFHRVY
jgi:hypothetical protein